MRPPLVKGISVTLKNENAALAFTIIASGIAGALIIAAVNYDEIQALKAQVRILKNSFDVALDEVPDDRMRAVAEKVQDALEFEKITAHQF